MNQFSIDFQLRMILRDNDLMKHEGRNNHPSIFRYLKRNEGVSWMMLGAVPETKSILLILWMGYTAPQPALHQQREVLVLLMVPGNCNPCDPKIYSRTFVSSQV